ncbi:MAG: glycosyltransferase family 2 protein [Paracoccus sp. (in: a-proteobacteria)]|nr:glycosyltransferase family 2 protein [Paracoccus sp. (in: a-proteobacteria)]
MVEELERQAAVLRTAGSFDPDWYQAQYPDVAITGLDPVTHYLRYGHRMQRDPGPDFSTRFARIAYGIKDEHEPLIRLDWMRRKSKAASVKANPTRVLMAANQVAMTGQHDRAIALAEAHLPADLAHTADILRANAALARADEEAWLRHVNAYLAHFGAAPLRLEGEGSVFDRLACAPIPPVTGGPLISVIMPAWNAEKTVGKAAGSILSQSWRNLELLIVDDASTDGTWAVLQEIAARDSRVKIMRNKVNVGPYVSKNIALTQARGAWVTGQDADDWAHPQRLAQHVDEAQSKGFLASLAYMLRITPDGRFSHLGYISAFSLDGCMRKALISCLFERATLNSRLGYWDTVRFSADSEMIARAMATLGDRFGVVPQIAMICQDLETSLTNHPEHGVNKQTGISPVRTNYRAAYIAWLDRVSSDDPVYLEFPQHSRRYDAADEMVVPFHDIMANLS